MSNSLNLALPYVEAAQAQKHVVLNDALRRLDAVVQLAVEDRTRTSPPPAPAEGDRHIVGAAAVGAWSGYDREVAAYVDGAWVFFAPRAGWLAFVEAEAAILYYTGTAWEILVSAGEFETAARFGVNGAGDDVNRLVVQSEAALFAPDPTLPVPTGDARIKVTKTASGDVASHLFQTGYSGRAEFGLIGSDDFSLKVSANGSTFTEAFSVDRASARLTLAQPPGIAGGFAFPVAFPTRAAVAAATVPAEVAVLSTLGFSAAGDGGDARYRRAAGEPSHAGKVRSADGAWWELDEEVVRPQMLGAVGGKVAAAGNDGAIRDAFGIGRPVAFDTMFHVTEEIVVLDNVTMLGSADRVGGLFWPADAASVGLVVRPQDLARWTTIRDIHLEREGVGGTALVVDLSEQTDWEVTGIDSLSQRAMIERNKIYGSVKRADGFAIGIHIVQGFKIILEANYIVGVRDASAKTFGTTYGILVEAGEDGSGQKLDDTVSVDLFRNGVHYCETAVRIVDQEGCNIAFNDFQAVRYGLSIDQTYRKKNQFRIVSNHIAFYSAAAIIRQADHVKLVGNEFAIVSVFTSWFWDPAVGEVLVTLEGARSAVIIGNTFRMRNNAGDNQLPVTGLRLAEAPNVADPGTTIEPIGIIVDQNLFFHTNVAIDNRPWAESTRWHTLPNAVVTIGPSNHYQSVITRATHAPAEVAAVHPVVQVAAETVESFPVPTSGMMLLRVDWQTSALFGFQSANGRIDLIAGGNAVAVVDPSGGALAIGACAPGWLTVAVHGGRCYVGNRIGAEVSLRYVIL